MVEDKQSVLAALKEESQEVLKEDSLDLISVIVPIYNVAEFLDKCIETILAQTYSNFELLLINDGSTDASPEICERYAQKDARVKVINKTNGGLSDARNLGLVNAKGEYVTFIDSDDFIEAHYLERLYVEIKRHNVSIAVSEYVRYADEAKTFYFHTKEAYTKVITRKMYLDEIFKTSTLAFVVAWGKLIKRSLFEGEFPIEFPKGRVAEDKVVTYLLAWKSRDIVYLHEPNYCYRQRPGSITKSQASVKRAADDILACEERMMDLVLTGYDIKCITIKQKSYLSHGIILIKLTLKLKKNPLDQSLILL